MNKHATPSKKSLGFTVIELMVATAVFSVVLVVVTGGILQISRLYYKGVTEANTQNTARSVMDTISQAIQFGGGGVVTTTAGAATPTSPKVFCLGNNQRFTYALGWQVVDGTPDGAKHQAHHALVQDNYSGCSASTPQNINVSTVLGRELLSPNMRLSKLDITQLSGNRFRIDLRIIYGDDDLLKAPPDSTTTTCINETAGTQFCSITELSTVVTKRVQ